LGQQWGRLGAERHNLSAVWGTCYGGAMAVTVEDLDRRATALEHAQNETTTTLRWVAGTLGRMQAVLEEHTQRLNDHTQRLERIETTLGDHGQRLDRIEGRLDRLEAKVDALPRAVAEQIDATEKRLLAAIAKR
jgi:chromosome segregation ATPase